MDISCKGILPGPKEEEPILFIQKSDVRRQSQLPICRRTQKKKNKKSSQKQAESIGAGIAVKELPRPLKELPRQPVPPKPRVKDAQLAALEAQGRATVAEDIARRVGELETFQRNDEDYQGVAHPTFPEDHSRKFGEHLAKGITGKGRKHDELEAGDHIMQMLRGGGVHTQDLLHTYVHSKVPRKRTVFRHKPVTNFHSQPELTGGSFSAPVAHQDGEPVPKSWSYPSHILVV